MARPAGVEGFLPISALLGLKYFLLTGSYDPAHPAGLTLLLFAILTGLLLRRSFCAFVCPVGLVSNLLATAGNKLGLERRLPRWAALVVRIPKYLLLAFFLITVGVGMGGPALQSFLLGKYNLTADAHLLLFFLHPSHTALVVFGLLGLLSLLFRNAWCRWLCPYGAFLGVLALTGITRVRRNPKTCVGCGRCQKVCPARIPVQEKKSVRTPECLGCGRCVGACPEPDALRMTILGRPVHWSVVGSATVAAFVLFWLVAKYTGHWDSSLPQMMLKQLYAGAMGGM